MTGKKNKPAIEELSNEELDEVSGGFSFGVEREMVSGQPRKGEKIILHEETETILMDKQIPTK